MMVLTPIAFALVRIVRSQEPKPKDTSAEDVQAIRRGGLREVARIRGDYVANITTGSWGKYDLESLTAHSGDIVVGRPIDNKSSHLSSDGQTITTWYRIKIVQTMKGKLQPGETLTVSLPGGKIIFEDGTSAEIRTPDFEGIQNDQEYVLFLNPKLRADGTFSLTGGGQGLFELNNESHRVKPHGHASDSVQKHKDEGVDFFLQEIKAAVKKYPDISACCN